MEQSPPNILIVEDDESISEAIAFHLKKAGMAVTVAMDGLAGLRAVKSALPDAMVLDLMPVSYTHLDVYKRQVSMPSPVVAPVGASATLASVGSLPAVPPVRS